MSQNYLQGRWGVFKKAADEAPIALLIDGVGMQIAPGGPIFQVIKGRLVDSDGHGGPLAAFNEGWVVNYGINDLGNHLKRLSV
ncbi:MULTISPECIES: hypothetical protein [Pseudomonas syringae group]|uniref:hypothetical protein n=1 Tax=Pseudomonas syringae group TaxID=136849 RepID=UPI000F0450B4|nr:hypothetical protein [Pseudomonas viridiflava]